MHDLHKTRKNADVLFLFLLYTDLMQSFNLLGLSVKNLMKPNYPDELRLSGYSFSVTSA